MAAVSRSFFETEERIGRAIAVLPGEPDADSISPPPGYPNKWVDIEIQTHLGARGAKGLSETSRNHINVLSSRAIVFLPGGEGTWSELRLATRYRRPAIAYLGERGRIAGRRDSLSIPVATELEEVASFLRRLPCDSMKGAEIKSDPRS